jgi:hypothetical protein
MTRLLAKPGLRLAVGLIAPALLLAWWQWFSTSGGASAVAVAPLGAVGAAFVELV